MYQIKPGTQFNVKDSADPDEPENWFQHKYHNDKPGTLSSEVEIVSVKRHGAVGDDLRFHKGSKHIIKAIIRPGDTNNKVLEQVKRKVLAGSSVVSADNAGTTEITITGSGQTNSFETTQFDVKITYMNNDNKNDVDYSGNKFWLKNAFEIKDGDNVNEGLAIELESSADFDFTAIDRVTTPV